MLFFLPPHVCVCVRANANLFVLCWKRTSE